MGLVVAGIMKSQAGKIGSGVSPVYVGGQDPNKSPGRGGSSGETGEAGGGVGGGVPEGGGVGVGD
jgi:hypothetical protein